MSELAKILQAIFIYINKGNVESDSYADANYIYIANKSYHKYNLKHQLYKHIRNRQPYAMYEDIKTILDQYYK